MIIEPPDLASYHWHRNIPDIDFDGTPVPGLHADFYRGGRDGRESVGVYRYPTEPVFMAWGYVGEPHCRYHAVRRADGGWQPAGTGCPVVRVLPAAADGPGLRLTGSETELVVGPGWAPTGSARGLPVA